MTVMRRKEMTVKSEHQCVDVMRSKKETSTTTTTTTKRGRPAFQCGLNLEMLTFYSCKHALKY
jgi:GTP cyclohydrolase I